MLLHSVLLLLIFIKAESAGCLHESPLCDFRVCGYGSGCGGAVHRHHGWHLQWIHHHPLTGNSFLLEDEKDEVNLCHMFIE